MMMMMMMMMMMLLLLLLFRLNEMVSVIADILLLLLLCSCCSENGNDWRLDVLGSVLRCGGGFGRHSASTSEENSVVFVHRRNFDFSVEFRNSEIVVPQTRVFRNGSMRFSDVMMRLNLKTRVGIKMLSCFLNTFCLRQN